MTSRQGRQAIAATAAMGVAVALALPTAAFAQSATQGKETATTTSSGTTYYVSSAHGDDANAGTSENAPWKSLTKVNDIASDLGPGDSVLLEYGSEFNDQYLHIKDTAGNADAPITISAYGDADEGKPVIASNGVKGSQWEQDYRANVGNHKKQGHRLNHAATQGRVVHHRLQPGDHQRRRGRLRSDRHVEVDRHP